MTVRPRPLVLTETHRDDRRNGRRRTPARTMSRNMSSTSPAPVQLALRHADRDRAEQRGRRFDGCVGLRRRRAGGGTGVRAERLGDQRSRFRSRCDRRTQCVPVQGRQPHRRPRRHGRRLGRLAQRHGRLCDLDRQLDRRADGRGIYRAPSPRSRSIRTKSELALDANNVIQASVTVTDGDGDTSVASVGIGGQIQLPRRRSDGRRSAAQPDRQRRLHARRVVCTGLVGFGPPPT